MSGSARTRALIVTLGSGERGDDGIGRRIAERIASGLPPEAELLDCGTHPLALLDRSGGHDLLLALDAAACLGAPGRIHRIDLSEQDLPCELLHVSSHDIGLAGAIALARVLGVLPARVIVYAVEGACFGRGAPMSPAVEQAADAAARLVLAELAGALNPAAARARSAGVGRAAGRRPEGAR